MATKFAQFLQDNKIDPRRILAVSGRIERLQTADRKIKFSKRKSKGEGAAKPAEGEKPAKPRSGRPVTPRLIDSATNGKPVAGAAKTRLLRAVNHILEQKKKKPVELKAVF
jgi:hypothetical protein